MAVVLYDHAVLADAFGPAEVLARAARADGSAAYELELCSAKPRVRAQHAQVVTPFRLDALLRADLVLVPGLERFDTATWSPTVEAIQSAAKRGATVASVCTGAFVLAATGLLDGKRATTHWRAADELARRFPKVRVDPDVLYVDEGKVLTSAGAAAGLDLALHLVRRDFGATVAADAARAAVMPLERAGGQAQFIVRRAPVSMEAPLGDLLRWMEANLGTELSLAVIARRAGMSTRTLSRQFRDKVGTTPASWVAQARVRRAQQLLETTKWDVERVAGEVGFQSSTVLRERFHAQVGVTPTAYRRAFARE